MPYYQLHQTQLLHTSIEEAWDFIANPANLKVITPDYMGFDIVDEAQLPAKMYPGMLIGYKVSPFLGLKLDWLTEITQVVSHRFFIDEQRVGPYTLWHHQHRIEPVDGGVLMTDQVTYKPPFGLLGALANRLLIANKLQEIFGYRRQKLHHLFNEELQG